MDFDEERNEETDQPNEDVEMADKVGDREAHEFKPSINGSSHDRRLFVGGISRMTTEESFREYFSKFGQVADSVLMCDKDSGRRRGFGFVIYADPEIADKVGKKVDVKKALTKTTRIYVDGLLLSLTEDELKEYFSSYGYVVDHCIILDRTTGWSGRFGFVSFDKEEAVEKVLSNGHMHEICGKQVEIKRSKPKRDCLEHTSESRIHHGGSGSKSYYSDGGSVEAVDMVEIWVAVMVDMEDMKDTVTMAGMASLQEVMVQVLQDFTLDTVMDFGLVELCMVQLVTKAAPMEVMV
ncbi:hypothetical protein RDI58_015932 [Solanum bulbocastanum]|uniref:RRM domain-containing protein n=1 Tax=Solanum bulbocastanum TaxID=147425 RepID=A0AAN8YCF6_SOLBU